MSVLSAAADTPRREPPPALAWRFPVADAPVEMSAPAVDPGRLIDRLGGTLGAVMGQEVVARSDDEAANLADAVAFVRDDDATIAIAFPRDLVGAIVGTRCGGPFVRAVAGGAGGAQVERELIAAVLAAADIAWPGAGAWSPTVLAPAETGFGVVLEIAGVEFLLSVAVTPPPPPPEVVPDHREWTRSLRAALDATPFAIRAVLHERTLPLGEALALRVGDVLPIETQRDISLRLGDRALARGTITPDGDGAHRVTIVAVGPAGVTPAQPEELP